MTSPCSARSFLRIAPSHSPQSISFRRSSRSRRAGSAPRERRRLHSPAQGAGVPLPVGCVAWQLPAAGRIGARRRSGAHRSGPAPALRRSSRSGPCLRNRIPVMRCGSLQCGSSRRVPPRCGPPRFDRPRHRTLRSTKSRQPTSCAAGEHGSGPPRPWFAASPDRRQGGRSRRRGRNRSGRRVR